MWRVADSPEPMANLEPRGDSRSRLSRRLEESTAFQHSLNCDVLTVLE